MKHVQWKKELGAIGIGTLIIFIALILVAAIASAVIIKTAEELEEKAKAAGQDAQKMVRASPMIVIAEGNVLNQATIDKLYLYIDLYGSEGIDMRDLIVHIVANPPTGNGKSADLTFNTASPLSATAAFFGTKMILDPLTQYDPTATPPRYILGDRARLMLTVDLTLALVNLPPASSLDIHSQVTTAGSERYDFFRTPSAYPNGGIVLLTA